MGPRAEGWGAFKEGLFPLWFPEIYNINNNTYIETETKCIHIVDTIWQNSYERIWHSTATNLKDDTNDVFFFIIFVYDEQVYGLQTHHGLNGNGNAWTLEINFGSGVLKNISQKSNSFDEYFMFKKSPQCHLIVLISWENSMRDHF